MKIALINPAPHYTGVGKYSLNLYKRLKSKIDIDYYFLNFKEKKIELRTRAGKTEIPVNTTVRRNFLFNKAAVKQIPRIYDLYHICIQDFSFAKLAPKIITCHDIIRKLYPRSWLEYIQQFFIYSGLKKARHILADSENTKKDMVEHLKLKQEKITVVPLGVESIFKPLPPKELSKLRAKYKLPNKKFILHISSEEPRKNYAHLLGAFARLKDTFPDHYILKVGNAWPKRAKKHGQLIRKLNISERVITIPTVPEEDLPAFYNIADVFVMPSIYEGFGLPLLEAMACGCPTIAYNTSSIPEVAGKASVLTPTGDIEQLMHSINNVLTDKRLRDKIRKEGIKQAKQFTWEKCAEQTLNAYKRCAA
jgi:glycosyltransferase involved in cell wall biosynthesis